jgi:flagellar hook-length control protein FliK
MKAPLDLIQNLPSTPAQGVVGSKSTSRATSAEDTGFAAAIAEARASGSASAKPREGAPRSAERIKENQSSDSTNAAQDPAALNQMLANGNATDPALAMPEIAITSPVQPIAIDPAVAATIAQTVFAVPSTGNFSPANPVSFAAGNSVDPAKLAATGFVADTLSSTPTALTSVTPDTLSSTPTALTSVTPDTSAAQSPWMTLAPDNLAFRLADRTFGGANTNVDLAPTQLALQNIEQQLGAIESQLGGSPISTDSADTAAPKAIDAPNGGITSINQGPQANLSTGTPEPVRLSVNAPVEQSSRWASEMGDRLAWVARNGMSSATLQVNPPQLGPIEVRIQMSGDQAAVSFAAVQPQTREAIQQALPALASSFAAQGLSLGQTSVGRDNQPQQSRGDGSSGNNANRGTDAIGAVSVDNISSSSGAIGTNRGGTGLVDTFV